MAKATIYDLAKLSGPDKQKQKIFDDLGNMKDFELLDDDVLVATYVDSEVAASGKRADGSQFVLYKPESATTEARYQGKAALVVALGPTAFKYHNNGQPYEGKAVKVGDWVVIHPSDGREIYLKDPKAIGTSSKYVACRRIHWSSILMRVDDPRRVY